MARFLRQLLQVPRKADLLIFPTRNVSTSQRTLGQNYEGDGKTTVTLLNREHKHLIIFDTISDHGFRLSNGIFAVGPIAAFPRTILEWNVNCIDDITPESLSLFTLLEPKLDVFVLGYGDKRLKIKPEIRNYLQANGINTEILHTEQACATFNFLNVEGRYVAGAFIPPSEVKTYEEMLLTDGEQHRLGQLII